jgi:membrane fusion protein
MSFKLFRDEVINAHHKRAYGDILIVYPVANYALAFIAIFVIAIIVAFFFLCHYTRRESVFGVLEPIGGVVKLYAPQSGLLRISNVQDGQRVHKGDVLLVFSTEHQGTDGKAVETELDKKLMERLGTMQSEFSDTLKLQKADADSGGLREKA